MGTQFRTMLAPINAPTGDGRRFAPSAITAAPTPFPFEWAREREMGHDGAVVIGAVHEVNFATVALAIERGWISAEAVKSAGLNRSMEAIWALGEIFDDVDREEMPRLAEDVAEAVKLISEGVLGPSVDLDSFEGIPVREGTDTEITWEDLEQAEEAGEDIQIELLVTEGRIRAATLVSIPAFQETSHPLELLESEDASAARALVAAVIGSVDLPVAAQEHDWDGQGARTRVFDAATNEDGDVDTDAVARAFLWRDPDQDASNRGAYSLGFADIIDGTLTIVPRGVAATAGGRGVDATDIPDEDKNRIKARICSLYDRIRNVHEEWPECPFDRDDEDSSASARTAALVASVTTPVGPAAALFDAPELAGPTPITFDWERGVVFGHIAVWGTCHGGFDDVCITPPKDPRGDYSWFHRYPVDTADGGTVWAGRLTVGGRHPGLNLSANATMAAYNDKTVAAQVRMYEDAFGIAVVGPINPDLDDASKRVLARRKVSGDWRETSDGLSLVELLALSPGPRLHSEPGFPVATHSRNGRQVALTAALGPDAGVMDRRAVATAEVRAALKAEREREQAAAELRHVLNVERDQAAAALRETLGVS